MPDRLPRHKLSLYFPDAMLREIEAEAKRLERPISWLIERAWVIYRKIKKEQEKQA